MQIQFKFSDVITDFLNREECMQAFLNATGISELQNLTQLHGSTFEQDIIATRSQGRDVINGFVISSAKKSVYVITPCYDYMRFWGHRNFFTWRLAKNHDNVNDGVERHVINILPQDWNRNSTQQFNVIKNCYIHNIYVINLTDELKEWLDALYK